MFKRHCPFLNLLALLLLFGTGCSGKTPHGAQAEVVNHIALEQKVPSVFKFVVFGDTRFHDPFDIQAANPAVRRALVSAIDKEEPAFVSIGGDIVYTGESHEDWHVWESETALWREHKIPVYPALGNHDLKGNAQQALQNYFAHFPELGSSRFYSVRAENVLLLILDSSSDELAGAQGDWLRDQLNHLPSGMDFVLLVFHHPVYTSSSDLKTTGGGHSARSAEQALGEFLEERQKNMRARIVVFNSHVHNYERHEHGGITYFVTGGGGAHAYPIPRHAEDFYHDQGINYHYLLGQVARNRLTVTMHKLEFSAGKEVWSQPDSVTILAPATAQAASH